MEYDGKNKSPYYGVWQSALMLAFAPFYIVYLF